jgi:hypothetical protein
MGWEEDSLLLDDWQRKLTRYAYPDGHATFGTGPSFN